jgi:hypothetical protein
MASRNLWSADQTKHLLAALDVAPSFAALVAELRRAGLTHPETGIARRLYNTFKANRAALKAGSAKVYAEALRVFYDANTANYNRRRRERAEANHAARTAHAPPPPVAAEAPPASGGRSKKHTPRHPRYRWTREQDARLKSAMGKVASFDAVVALLRRHGAKYSASGIATRILCAFRHNMSALSANGAKIFQEARLVVNKANLENKTARRAELEARCAEEAARAAAPAPALAPTSSPAARVMPTGRRVAWTAERRAMLVHAAARCTPQECVTRLRAACDPAPSPRAIAAQVRILAREGAVDHAYARELERYAKRAQGVPPNDPDAAAPAESRAAPAAPAAAPAASASPAAATASPADDRFAALDALLEAALALAQQAQHVARALRAP